MLEMELTLRIFQHSNFFLRVFFCRYTEMKTCWKFSIGQAGKKTYFKPAILTFVCAFQKDETHKKTPIVFQLVLLIRQAILNNVPVNSWKSLSAGPSACSHSVRL